MSQSLGSIVEELGGELLDATSAVFAAQEAAPSSHYSPGVTSSVEERAAHLLGLGIGPEQVAAALGVTASRISQLLAEKTFADRVSVLRYKSMQKHNKRDSDYDRLEDSLISKLERSLPLLVRPDQILAAVKVINGAKRRGASSSVSAIQQNTTVTLVMPTKITQQFVTNINNQVIKAGDQNLQTMQSSELLRKVETAKELALNVQRVEHGSEYTRTLGECEELQEGKGIS